VAEELPELLLPHVDAWHHWLAEHHTEPSGVWLVLSRKGGSVTSLTYDQALDEALCVGWIDGQVRRRDEGSFRQRWTPRRQRSPWSERNVGHVVRLTEQGRMQPAGVAAVAAAKADGRWDLAYAGQASAVIPADLADAVAAEPGAQAMFEVLTSQNRYALIFRLSQVTDPSVRARRIDEFVTMLARGQTPHPQRARPPGT